MTNPWKDARSLADLGNAMADWLEGRNGVRTWPGYCSRTTEPETRHLIPTLAAANRAGYVTTGSQPGHVQTGRHRGRGWEERQRAAVDGYIADGPLLRRITAGARQAGIVAIVEYPGVPHRNGMVVTTDNGEPFTWFGQYYPRGDRLETEWPRTGPHAVAELRRAIHLTLIDPEWARDTVLWPALARALA